MIPKAHVSAQDQHEQDQVKTHLSFTPYKFTNTHARTHARAHTHAHTHTHTLTHTQKYTNVNTHTHTHTHSGAALGHHSPQRRGLLNGRVCEELASRDGGS